MLAKLLITDNYMKLAGSTQLYGAVPVFPQLGSSTWLKDQADIAGNLAAGRRGVMLRPSGPRLYLSDIVVVTQDSPAS